MMFSHFPHYKEPNSRRESVDIEMVRAGDDSGLDEKRKEGRLSLPALEQDFDFAGADEQVKEGQEGQMEMAGFDNDIPMPDFEDEQFDHSRKVLFSLVSSLFAYFL